MRERWYFVDMRYFATCSTSVSADMEVIHTLEAWILEVSGMPTYGSVPPDAAISHFYTHCVGISDTLRYFSQQKKLAFTPYRTSAFFRISHNSFGGGALYSAHLRSF